MSRTIRQITPRQKRWHGVDYHVVKAIEHYGYFCDSNFCATVIYDDIVSFYEYNYSYKKNAIVHLKKAAAANDLSAWIRASGAKSPDLTIPKLLTGKVKRKWRYSFKKNFQMVDYNEWDYVKYPKLLSNTYRNH